MKHKRKKSSNMLSLISIGGVFALLLTVSSSFGNFKHGNSSLGFNINFAKSSTYTATFYDEDRTTVLYTQEVASGETPTYGGSSVYKPSTSAAVYYHNSWQTFANTPIGPISADTNYYPTFTSLPARTIKFKANTWNAFGRYYSIWYKRPGTSTEYYSNAASYTSDGVYELYVPSAVSNVTFRRTATNVSGQTSGAYDQSVAGGTIQGSYEYLYETTSNTAGRWLRYVYLDIKDFTDWGTSSAKFAVYYFVNDFNNGFSTFMQHLNKTQYRVTIPVGYNNIIFTRHDSSALTPTWDNKWNQSVDVTNINWASATYEGHLCGYIHSSWTPGVNLGKAIYYG